MGPSFSPAPPRSGFGLPPPQAPTLHVRVAAAIQWVRDQRRGLTALAVLLAFGIGGVLWWRHTVDRAESAADAALFAASEIAAASSTPEAPAVNVVAGWQAVIERYPTSGAALVARLRLGSKWTAEGKWSEVLEVLLPAVEATPQSGVLHAVAAFLVAQAYEGSGEFAKAIEWYRTVEKIPQGIDSAPAVQGIVRAMTAMGHSAEALELLEEANLPQDVKEQEALWITRSTKGS